MSLIVTPSLAGTETLQVATPLSYSFTYSEVIVASDTPVYYFNGNVFAGNNGSNSTIIRCSDTQNPASGQGIVYTVSNMTATSDVLECILPILSSGWSFDPDTDISYVTFGGPTNLVLTGGPPDTNPVPPITGHFATFGAQGPFQYAISGSNDSLKYIPLTGTPVSSFSITLARPNISNVTINITDIVSNLMTVSAVTNQGAVNIGMIFPVQGGPSGLTRAFTVTAFGTGKGNTGTYTVTPNTTPGTPLNTGSLNGISSTTVTGSGDIILSNSMTPSDGFAQFKIFTTLKYTFAV